MSILKPTLIYTGQVTGSPAYGARVIALTTISGSLASLEEGCTLKVKDASGNLVCKRRYRETIGSTIKIDENTVTWSNTYTIEAYNQFELWPKYPYIDKDDNYRFYKDYDIAYVDQNIRIPPVAIMGSHRAGFLENGSITFILDASESYGMPISAAMTRVPIRFYKWTCPTGTIEDDDDDHTSITFTTPGYHIVKLEVTDGLRTKQFTRRVFFVHERTGVNAPFVDFDLDSIQCSWSDGGCTMTTTLRGDDRIADIEDNALVVLWSENWYNGVKENIGENGNTRFVGYILSETIQRSLSSNEVSFEVGTIDALMKNISMYSISLQTKAEVTISNGGNSYVFSYHTWYIYPPLYLTVTNALHHLWKWHSTLLEIADVFLPIENLYSMTACDDMTDGNLFTLAEWAYDNGIFAKTYCDQFGILHVDVDSLILSKSERDNLDIYMDITTQDWRLESGIQIDRRKDSQAGLVIASGVAYVPSQYLGAEYAPLMAQAPGAIPNNYGNETINIERLVLYDQAQLNMLVGRLYAIANSDISEIRLEFSGDYPITMSPKSWYTLTIPASYTRRGIDLDVRMQCRSITYNISMSSGVIYPSCIFEVDVESLDGITIDYQTEAEIPYAPTPPYVPNVPYVPNIPVVYPTVPTSPWPNYPGGAPTTVIPGAPTIPAINPLCRTQAAYSANGPYNVFTGEVVGGSTVIPVEFFLRGTNYTNVTKYTLNGYFYSVNDTTGEYEITMEDNFYEIYALNASGVRVATGIHDAVEGDGYQRTGTFNAPSGIDISAIEFVCKSLILEDYTNESDPINGYTDWYPPVYSGTKDPGVLTTLVGSDDSVAFQLTHMSALVSNPPWVWNVSGSATFSLRYTSTSIPDWFDFIFVAYPFQTTYESIRFTIRNPINANIFTQESQLQSYSGKLKVTGYGHPTDLSFNIGMTITYSNVGNVNIGGGDPWVSFFALARPILSKVTVDSLLLWNVCGHT
jgi:hypothetical protein